MKEEKTNLINVCEWITKWAKIQPDKIAIISEGIPYTYSQFKSNVNRISHLFLNQGVKKGDRIALLLRNSRQFIEIFFAISGIGAIMVPLNWRLALPELELILKDCGTDFIMFDYDFLENAERLRKRLPMKVNIACSTGEEGKRGATPDWAMDYDELLNTCPDSPPIITWNAGDDDPHILMYTSGTTGLPKGAVLSHRKTFFNVLNANIYYDLSRKDVGIVMRPLFHSGGLIVDMSPVIYRGGTVIIKKRFTPEEILKTIEKYRVTILEMPATVYSFIINECRLDDYDLSSLKCCFTGGERVPVSLLQEYAKKGIALSQVYGLTEVSTLFWLPMEKAMEKMGSVGQPVMHSEVVIVDDEGRPVKKGEVGEVAVKGPIVMNGYWNKEDLTDEVIRDGWFYTGDLAMMDEDGYVYIVDRKKDMYISGGENVYPAEIEKVLLEHPHIKDAAVIGVPDKKWNEVGKAYIVVKEGKELKEEEIYAFLNERLARYKLPKYIQFIDKLPKTASGKIKKSELK
ncbi:MAG: long-chain fatty acid--CoA ligase [Syntrophorhabdaceae bacterium]|nr:long-chain fatty acid--CoA ligase [Syntrophorhabdaceae bacterium]